MTDSLKSFYFQKRINDGMIKNSFQKIKKGKHQGSRDEYEQGKNFYFYIFHCGKMCFVIVTQRIISHALD